MAELELRKVDRWHHRRIILDGLSLKAPSGRITALLGDEESGCVAALKVIAGIEKLQGGSILIGGEDVGGEKEGVREAATVFRSAALMPHKSALENIAYPLRIARFDQQTIEERVLAVAEHFGLMDVLKERPKRLTDVQCYQIGLARALVRDPGVYLFELPPEEDTTIRELAIGEMRRLRDEFGRTVVYVAGTVDSVHDLADWVVVLHEGRRLQMGRPERLVQWPVSRQVAKLFGARLRAARIEERERDSVTVSLKDGTILTLPCESRDAAAGERATLAIWPEHIDREGETAVYPPEHCYLFDARGHLVQGPFGLPPKPKPKKKSSRRR